MNIHDADDLRAKLVKFPTRTQAKIEDLIFENTAAHGALSSASDLLREARARYSETRMNILRGRELAETMTPDGPKFTIVSHRRNSPNQEETDRDTAPIRTAWRDVQRYQKMHEAAKPRWEAYAFLSDISAWLADPKNSGRNKPSPLPTVKGKDHVAAVEDLRKQIAEIDDKMAAVESAPLTLTELTASANREVDDLAGKVAPSVYMASADPVRIDDNPRWLIWALKDTIKAAIAKELAERHDGDGLSAFERAAELSALDAEKLTLERAEEAHIVAATSAAINIPRRRDASPLAILETQ